MTKLKSYPSPKYPCRVDDDMDIVDASGRLVCYPARGVEWSSDEEHAQKLCEHINGEAKLWQ